MKYPIGTQFIPMGRNDLPYTVVDSLTTFNMAGDIIKQTYLCEHEFLGQKIRTEECATTIARSLPYNGERP